MGYSANPRKIYGKVEIIYFDNDMASIDDVVVSSEALISHPSEVHGASIQPSIKACVLGDATLDETYQMMDDESIIGWWGGVFSDVDGCFINPETLELFFMERPIKTWLVIGDAKLNEYPVDFSVTYKRGTEIIKIDNYFDNNEVNLKLNPQLADITSIKLEITKWSKQNACVKIMKFFDILAEVYYEKDLKSFEVSEEVASQEGEYNINSDTMNVIIYNRDEKFSEGYLKKLLILDRKVKPFIGIEANGEIVYSSLGTFYSDEWSLDTDGLWLKCIAVDKLLRLQNKIYIGYPLTIDASMYDLAKDILLKANFSEDEFVISEELKSIIIPFAFLERQSVWDALQEVAVASLSNVFIDRDDRINIKLDKGLINNSNQEVNSSNMFSYLSNISLTKFANKILVEYAEVELTDYFTNAIETEVQVLANSSMEVLLNYNLAIYDAFLEIIDNRVLASDTVYGINACKTTLTNTTSEDITLLVKVSGYIIDITYNKITTEEIESIKEYGDFEYSHPTSDLVQSSEYAQSIGAHLLNRMKQGEGSLSCIWRGDPALRLKDEFSLKAKKGALTKLVCEYNKFTYDGSLKQETRGRKITGGA